MNTREKYVIFRWLKTVGKFQNKSCLPKNSELIQQLKEVTRQWQWTKRQIKQFAIQKGIEFPELQCKPKHFVQPKKRDASIPVIKPQLIASSPNRDPAFSVEKYSEFMSSENWRSVRYLALRKYGNHCKACGRGPEDSVKIHVDHIVPCSRAWDMRLSINNLQILCEDCNMGKGGSFADDWRFNR